MMLISTNLYTSFENLVPLITYFGAGLLLQIVYVLVLLEVLSLMKLNFNKKKVFIISSVICSVISIAVNINNAYSGSANFQVHPFETLVIWTLVCVLTALVSLKPAERNQDSAIG